MLSSKKWLIILLFVSCIRLVILFFSKSLKKLIFPSDQPFFILKIQQDIYDSFYSTLYPSLFSTSHVIFEADQILQGVSENKPLFLLDIGAGKGEFVTEIKNRGHDSQGLELSKEMKGENLFLSLGNCKEKIMFDKNTFTHITCLGMTFYEILSQMTISKFIDNCYFWLEGEDATLIIHLVDDFTKFDPFLFMGKSSLYPEFKSIDREKNTIEFQDFIYKEKYDVTTTEIKKEILLTEKNTNKTRQHQQFFPLVTPEEIIQEIEQFGLFTFDKKISFEEMGDSYQSLYFFKK